MPTAKRRATVRIVTLGCPKNEVDSEEIAGVLLESGYDVDGSSPRADVVVINTCGFLEASKRESLREVRRALAEKRSGRVGKVIVAGCLAQRHGQEIAELAPGADAYVGVGQMKRFAGILDDLRPRPAASSTRPSASTAPLVRLSPPQHLWAGVGTRARAGKPWSAYLKVSEGCDHKCSFCTIPSFRGPHASKPLERVLDEARFLAESGAKEINLVAQDVTQYGYDLYRRFTLPNLLRRLNDVDGIEWIRVLYFYPSRLTDEVVEAMATLPKVCPYIDIPLQHSHAGVLRRMRRPWSGERYLRLFEKLRTAMPDCAIRTTFIVGFPGETEAEFEHLLEFVKAARLDRVGAFRFSREPGTPSHDMPGQIPERLKRERYARLMELQHGISLEVNRSWAGRALRVLAEERSGGHAICRSHRDAPEIDGLVFVESSLEPGEFHEVRVVGAEPYDLHAVKA